jgi:hypothetical protein
MKTRLLIILGLVIAVSAVTLTLFPMFGLMWWSSFDPRDSDNPAFQTDYPRISQNDMYCWTQWYMKNTTIDEGKLISSIRSTIAMFGSDFDISDREVTVIHNDEETIISIAGSWTKDKTHHEKLTSVIEDHIGDSKIIRDDIVMCA